ncbi:MAG: PAS domain S-box protein [Desulfobacteraceae bacterium]|nr:PAS domain S-box protein [Desulfobacteraceae bacterium]
MKTEHKTKNELITELVELSQQISNFQKLEATHRQAQEDRWKSEKKYRLVVENVSEAIIVVQNGKFMFFNEKALEITGCSREEFLSKSFRDFFHPTDRKLAVKRHFDLMKGKDVPNVYSFRIIDEDNNVKWLECNSVLIEWDGESATLNCLTEITKRKHAEQALLEREARYRTLFENANDAIVIETEKEDIVEVNDRACELFGYDREELVAMKSSDLWPSTEGPLSIYSNPQLSLDIPIEMTAVNHRGEKIIIEMTITPLVNGRQTLFMTIARDITERKEAEKRIKYLSLHDSLTGLPNRNLFYDRLVHSISRGHRYQHTIAVLFIDLNQFRLVNEKVGQKIGDKILKQVAKRLTACIRETDTAARIGGDEFAVILQDLQKKYHIKLVAEKIIESVSQEIRIQNKTCSVGASIGISAYPWDGEDVETLMRRAETAMNRIRGKGRNNYCFFNPS